MIIVLPKQFRAKDLFPFFRAQFGNPIQVPKEVIFDFSMMSFVRPSGIVFLSNLSRFLMLNGSRVIFQGMNINRECIRYLDDSGFIAAHTGQSLRKDSKVRATTMPLHRLPHNESHNWIGSELLPWLSNHSKLPLDELLEFKTCMSEVFNNIVDHSEIDTGSIFSQWYPQEKKLQIAIADFGVGIPTTVRSKEPDHSDAEAILRAFDDGFSAQSTPQNRGAGLFYLKQNVLDNLGGKLTVRSQNGAVDFTKSGNSLSSVPYEGIGFCPGTMIEIEIRTDRFVFENNNVEDFQW